MKLEPKFLALVLLAAFALFAFAPTPALAQSCYPAPRSTAWNGAYDSYQGPYGNNYSYGNQPWYKNRTIETVGGGAAGGAILGGLIGGGKGAAIGALAGAAGGYIYNRATRHKDDRYSNNGYYNNGYSNNGYYNNSYDNLRYNRR